MLYKKGNISKRSVFIFSVIFLIIIFATVMLSYISTAGRLNTELTDTNITMLKHIMRTADMQLQEIDREMIGLINDPDMCVFMYESYESNSLYYVYIQRLLGKIHDIQFTNSNIYSVYLYSAGQKKILTDKAGYDMNDFYDTEWMEKYASSKKYYTWLDTRRVTEINNGQTDQKYLISLVRAYPVASHPENRTGAIVVSIKESVFNGLINGNRFENLGDILVLNQKGVILSNSSDSKRYEEIGLDNSFFSMRMQGLQGRIDEKSYSVFYVTSPYTGWKYVNVIPHVQMNQLVVTIRNVLLYIAAGMFLIAIIMAFFASKWACRPAFRFIHTVNQTVEGSQIALREEKHTLETFEELEELFSDVITDYDKARKQVKESIPAIRAKLITDILLGYLTNYQEVVQHLKMADISLYPANFIVMVIELDGKSDLLKANGKEGLPDYLKMVRMIAEEAANQECKGASVVLDERVAMLLCTENDNSSYLIELSFLLARKIQQQVFDRSGITVTVGIGSYHKNMADIPKSFHEATETLKYKILIGCNSVISIDNIRLYNERDLYGVFSSANGIALAIRMTDIQAVYMRLDHLFEQVKEKNMPSDLIRQLGMQLIIEGIQAALDTNLDLDDILGEEDSGNVYQALNYCETVSQMKEYIKGLFSGLIRQIKEKRNNRNNNILIDRILEYIQQHYMENSLSLNLLAELFHISVPYLSKIFKETVETNFMDYLIQVRIAKAKELLAKNMKINDISNQVGYANVHSFIRVFKKYTGKTPGEYRNAILLPKGKDNKGSAIS